MGVGYDFGRLVEQSCKAAEKAVATILSDVLETELSVEVHGLEELTPGRLPEHLVGPCCFIVLEGKHAAAILAIPAEFSFAPAWFANDDEVAARLGKIAAQLHILLPDVHPVIHGWAIRVLQGNAALLQAGLGQESHQVLMEIHSGQQVVPVSLVWPVAEVGQLLTASPWNRSRQPLRVSFEEALAQLPPYLRSFLRVRVPASVVLASTRMPLKQLLQMGPGSILTFRKSCDETLELQITDQTIAVGEAVRVGNRFGLWITSMALPPARFQKVLAQAAAGVKRPYTPGPGKATQPKSQTGGSS